MRELKTWEMIKELTENPSKKFVGTDFNGNPMYIYWKAEHVQDGYLYDRVMVAEYDVDNEIKPFFTNGLYVFKKKWTEVIEPVSFEVAYKDCKLNGKRYRGQVDGRDKMYRSEGGVEVDNDDSYPVLIEQLWIPID